MNKLIISKLTELSDLYKKDPSLKFKYNAITKALSYIKQYEYNIVSGKYAIEHIPNIGTGIAKRIDEILATGTLVELNEPANVINKELDDHQKAIENLTQITGMGVVRAKGLVNSGIMTIDQYKDAIKDGRVKSTHHIDIGLKYFDKINERIPRKEIEELEVVIRKQIKKLSKTAIFSICGSYRRGKETCGDIDVLFTDKITNRNDANTDLLHKLVEELSKIGFLIDHLTTNGDKKYMGICKGSRRIDIRYVEYKEYYAALLYFTGSKDFNIQIRNKAISAGYSLSEYGLKEKNSGKMIELHSEEELFTLLKIPYVKPTDRNL